MKIRRLRKDIIAKVAAGQVIDRPASVVKELVENSIDAGATNIEITIEKAGKKLISVKDNGKGMSEEDLLQSVKRYTTSKIKNFKDISNLSSFGFRGEAIHSIGQTSILNIQTKTKRSSAGNCLVISDGKVLENKKVGMTSGTLVEVKELFLNIPARKKHLKTDGTEYSHILDTVLNYVFSYPQIGFLLSNNGKKVFIVSSSNSLKSRITKLLNLSNESLIKIKYSQDYLKLNGFITKPQNSSYSRNELRIFINNRPVIDEEIVTTVKSSYSELLEKHTFPKGVIFLTLPKNRVDVNVSPKKELVDIANKKEVLEMLYDGIKNSLKNADLSFNYVYKNKTDKEFYGFLADKLKETEDAWSVKKNEDIETVLQIGKLFLVAQYKDKLLLIDQHAAHEKVLYNQFLDSFKVKSKKSKVLSPVLLLELSLSEHEDVKNYLSILQKAGFEIEEFGGTSFKVNKAPCVYNKNMIKEIILSTISDLKESKIGNVNANVNKALSYLACRTAIKANEYLTNEERVKLVKKVLVERETTYTCPHGRPVMVEINFRELNKMFYR